MSGSQACLNFCSLFWVDMAQIELFPSCPEFLQVCPKYWSVTERTHAYFIFPSFIGLIIYILHLSGLDLFQTFFVRTFLKHILRPLIGPTLEDHIGKTNKLRTFFELRTKQCCKKVCSSTCSFLTKNNLWDVIIFTFL